MLVADGLSSRIDNTIKLDERTQALSTLYKTAATAAQQTQYVDLMRFRIVLSIAATTVIPINTGCEVASCVVCRDFTYSLLRPVVGLSIFSFIYSKFDFHSGPLAVTRTVRNFLSSIELLVDASAAETEI